MSTIGMFKLAKDGGWAGEIRTVAIDAKVRLVPNDDRTSPNAPAFRVMLGWSRVGEAWEARSGGDNARDYLRVRLDDPTWAAPIAAALFPDVDGETAQLVWSRPQSRRTDQ
ncbi:MAG TPA: DUF736 family protein [Caulobacteraceae bacterium]|jgi:uncharacterized protein (DUF736 family)|nr:DUF736 family protein [Caulobacteraceae bacterium]